MISVLERHSGQHPEKRAFTFLQDRDRAPLTLRFGDLVRHAKSMGAFLRGKAQPGSRVLLLYPTGPDYITALLGCFFGGFIAVPLYPPRPNQKLYRVNKIIEDCKPTIALTTDSIFPRVQKLFMNAAHATNIGLHTTPAPDDLLARGWSMPATKNSDPAYLQYTSGSTGDPKGVLISHGNLMANIRALNGFLENGQHKVFLNWLPLYHDMGLINTVLHPLFGGYHSVLMSSTAFIREPLSWLRQISDYQAHICGGPNFAYDLCAAKANEDDVGGLDLSSWEIAYNGAESISAETVARFSQVFRPAGFRPEVFYPCYGMAESTLMATGGEKNRPPQIEDFELSALEGNRARPAQGGTRAQALVGCGRALPNHRILIVDPKTLSPLPENHIGEIWIAGPSIAKGYWKRPDETREVFGGFLAESGEGPFLRSGDLGFLRNNELFVTGRLKDLIIIRGRNHYPADIEHTAAMSTPQLQTGRGAAFSVDCKDAPRLVLVQEILRGIAKRLDFDQAASIIRRAVSEQHALRIHTVVFVKQGGIPKTTSGKIRHHECRSLFLADKLACLHVNRLADAEPSVTIPDLANLAGAEWEVIQARLTALIATVIGIAPQNIDSSQPLLSFGLDSMSATELQHRLHTDVGITVPLTRLLEGLSLSDLAAKIRAAPKNQRREEHGYPEKGPEPETFPLSYNQRALWFLYRISPASSAYHLSFALKSRKPIDVPFLKRCFENLTERHPVLRILFCEERGRPLQRICSSAPASFSEIRATTWSDERLRKRLNEVAHQPFDLTREPPIRIRLFHRADKKPVLLWTMHHIAIDYWSVLILIDEWRRLAENEAEPAILEEPDDNYASHVLEQEAMLAGERGARCWKYWKQSLSGPLPYLNLSTDRPRPTNQTDNGALFRFRLSHSRTRAMRAMAQKGNTTLYTVMLTAFCSLLHRYGGQEDILVGSPTAGRRSPRFKDLVGYLVNPLVMRCDLSGRPNFQTLMERTRHTVLAALEHQDFPFQLLVERLKPERSLNRSPLFQVMFTMYKANRLEPAESLILMDGGKEWIIGPLHFDSLEIAKRSAQFELSLIAIETEHGLACALEYNTDLFNAGTMAGFSRHFENFLEAVGDRPNDPIATVPIMDEGERRRILEAYSNPARFRTDRCLHQLFFAQSRKTPNAEAVVFGNRSVTYLELASRVSQLAHQLRVRGVKRGNLVGLCMMRSLEMVTGLLAILRTGAAYVPLEPSFPRRRLALLLEDACISVALTQKPLASRLPLQGLELLLLDETETDQAGNIGNGNPSPEDPMYVMYTSGSTGKPKGVVLTHRAVFNRIWWMQIEYGLIRDDRVLQKTPFSFDVSVWEFFWPLSTGAALVVAEPEAHKDPEYLVRIIETRQISIIHFVPSMLKAFLEHDPAAHCRSLKRVFSSGEALTLELQTRFFEVLQAKLYNLYGPTEAAIDVTAWTCEPDRLATSVPIGNPIANIQTWVLDREMHLLPQGIPGELFLAGLGLARGYYHRPTQTAACFLPHPFSHTPGSRLYQTGDAARGLLVEAPESGPIEFLGRLDSQVKVRGNRIETGEIEVWLNRHDLVMQAAVLAAEIIPGDTRLTAFVVPDAANQPTPAALHRYLEKELPGHMIPGAFVMIDSLPLNPSGKLDRRVLKAMLPSAPDAAQLAKNREFIPPRTATEKQIAEIWREVLGLDRIGVSDNFFRMGGHSLLGIQAISRLNETFRISISVRYLFEQPTIAALAEYIESTRWATETSQRLRGDVEYERGEV